MLVLSRLEGDSISVPDIDLAIRILKISGGRIRLGIEAPDHVRVRRTETVSSKTISSSGDQAENDSQSTANRPSSAEVQTLSKRITQATLALQIAQRHYQRGENAQAEAALDQALQACSTDGGRPSRVCEDQSEYLVHFPSQDSFRILLIENESSDVNSLDDLLDIPNIEIQIASDVVDAISYLDEGSHDLLILEPRENAAQIDSMAQRIRSDRRFDSMAIVTVTTAARPRKETKLNVAGMLV